ncbi:GntR family transcriptional regulator [Planctomycetota bacterium]
MTRRNASLKYEKVKTWIREKIESGEWEPGMKLPPQAKLFTMLKASDSTVVHALTDLAREGLITRRRGSGTFVAERDVPPLIPGRHLRLGILWLQSIVAQHMNTPSFLSGFTRGILKAWGVDHVVPEYSQDEKHKVTRAIWHQPSRGITVEGLGEIWGGTDRRPPARAVKAAGFDGMISIGIIEDDFLGRVLDYQVPTVIGDYPSQTFGNRADLVYADPQLGYRAAIEDLVSRDITRIHFVGAYVWDPHKKLGPRGNQKMVYGKRIDPDSFLRLSAYRQAMDACGIEVPESWLHVVSNDEDKREKLSGFLTGLPEAERPQAVICHDAHQTDWLIRAFRQKGLDLEGAGACSEEHYGFGTRIQVNTHQMGAVSAELLIARIKDPVRPYLNVGVRMEAEKVYRSTSLQVDKTR